MNDFTEHVYMPGIVPGAGDSDGTHRYNLDLPIKLFKGLIPGLPLAFSLFLDS